MNDDKMMLSQLCHSKNTSEIISQILSNTCKGDEVIHLKTGDTVLHMCAKQGYTDVIDAIIKTKSCNIDVTNFDGKRPLHDTAQYSQLDALKLLIAAGANVNSIKRADWSPLMLACTKGNLEIIQCLMDAGADVTLQNKDGWTAFHLACREGHDDIIEYMIGLSKDLCFTKSNNKRTPLHTAALHGHLTTVGVLMDALGSDFVDVADSCGSTPLMDACRGGFKPVVQFLHEKWKASVEHHDAVGRTAVHVSAECGEVQCLQYLVEECHCSPDVTSRGHLHLTPLHLAAKEGQHHVIAWLLTKSVDVDALDCRHRTAAEIAEQNRHVKCVELLMKK